MNMSTYNAPVYYTPGTVSNCPIHQHKYREQSIQDGPHKTNGSPFPSFIQQSNKEGDDEVLDVLSDVEINIQSFEIYDTANADFDTSVPKFGFWLHYF